MSTLAELTKPLTPDEVKASIYAGIAASGVSTTTWKPGAATRTIIAVVSAVLAAFSVLIAEVANGGFLELALGAWLTLLARHVYGVERDPGSFATGSVTLTNTAGGSFINIQPGDLIVKKADGKTYRNTAVFTLAAAPSSVSVAVQADELGSGSTASPGTITAFVTSFVGVTVTNPGALVGNDEELDPALRVRCREKTGSLSPNGPRDAYSYVAKTATRADGTSIGVTRVRTLADGIGGVDVYVADADGDIPGTVGNLGTDLGRVDDAIQKLVTPLAITARVHSADPLVVNVTWEAWVRDTSGLSDAEILAIGNARLVTWFADQPIAGEVVPPDGGRVYVEGIAAALADELTDEVAPVVRLQIALPAADVAVAPTEAPKLGTPVGIIHQVSARGTS